MKKLEVDWLTEEISALTERLEMPKPSDLAERIRFLPPSTTNHPGPFRFDVAPYTEEIVDCFDVNSPVRSVAVKKGVQLAYTVGVLENIILYYMVVLRTSPVLFATADNEMSDLRVSTNIVPMIQNSTGVEELVASGDRLSANKKGKTALKIEWKGGGWLFSVGANNPTKGRSFPFPCVLLDEVDNWPLTTKEGPPVKLFWARMKTFEDTRKGLIGSTPVNKGTSVIDDEYKMGDQRKYFADCLGCGKAQSLKWHRVDRETGEVSGMAWEMKDGQVVRESVRYTCRFCGHAHREEDKPRFLGKKNARWVPTATPADPGRRSYHMPAMISLVQSWYACVVEWIEAVGPDLDEGQPLDMGKLQVFYNNVLAEAFEMRGQRATFGQVSAHRRIDYALGTVPTKYAKRVTGSDILLLTLSVDVHDDGIYVAVWGWTRGLRAFVIFYEKFEGNPADEHDPGTWERLSDLLENQQWKTDDNRTMRLSLAVLDSQHLQQQVYAFCARYPGGAIYPIKGRDIPIKGATMPFTPFSTPQNSVGFHIVVDHYKDAWAQALRKHWSEGGRDQPERFFNAPVDLSDAALRELTTEYKRPKVGGSGKKTHEWHRPKGSKNELWDLLIYASASLDIACLEMSKSQFGSETQDWLAFWAYLEQVNAGAV